MRTSLARSRGTGRGQRSCSRHQDDADCGDRVSKTRVPVSLAPGGKARLGGIGEPTRRNGTQGISFAWVMEVIWELLEDFPDPAGNLSGVLHGDGIEIEFKEDKRDLASSRINK
jgi:hypothetical protein